ncbi:kinase-like domain-containing protein [Halenospora varia]|nr:kinase-like domain-containing protein [Halenospora varia]
MNNGVPRSPAPQIFIGTLPYRSSTFPTENPNDFQPPIVDDDETRLDELLRKNKVEGADAGRGIFWSRKLLSDILSRERVLTELKAYTALEDAEIYSYLDDIRPEDDRLFSKNTKTYLATFALLVLLDRGEEIGNFIREEVSDQNLPVCLYLGAKQEKVPLASHYDLDAKTILPWRKRHQNLQTSMQPSGQGGGFGIVSTIEIDPSSHGFRDILRQLIFCKQIHLKDDLFALKVLKEEEYNNEEAFQNELNQLRRFNGFANPHLVTLLATFKISQRYHFIFPYADSNLEYYWQDIEPNPKMDIATVRWVSRQLSGIMGAIDVIHEPKHLPHLDVKRYGRHGDIKPDNILWFRSSNNERGTLVLSDMGLSAFHRENSKSGIPRYKIPKVPGYQPPECDVKGGKISRAYDIWTLGCLYLELLTWLLGGWKLLDEFEMKRKSVHITGSISNIFFTLKTIQGREGHVAQVKTQVAEWFRFLHSEKTCPQFLHDALDIIEKEMLIVMYHERPRTGSTELRKKFEEIHKKCMDENNSDYCLQGKSIERPTRKGTVVAADLTKDVKDAILEHKPELLSHDPIQDGRIKRSMLQRDWDNMDKVQ